MTWWPMSWTSVVHMEVDKVANEVADTVVDIEADKEADMMVDIGLIDF